MVARLWGRVARTAVSTLLVAVALVVGTLFVSMGDRALLGGDGGLVTSVVVLVTLAELGFVATASVFLLASDDGREYVRVSLPDGRDGRYAVGGLAATYAVALAAALTARASNGNSGALGPGEVGSGEGIGSVREFEAVYGLDPGSVETALLALVVLSVLVIGPCEELLFRGVIQRYLSGVFSRASAVVVTSVLFTAVHAPTFVLAASGLASVAAAATIFAISVLLGYAYALTDNLVVPTVVHGVYDATLFGLLYLGIQMGMV